MSRIPAQKAFPIYELCFYSIIDYYIMDLLIHIKSLRKCMGRTKRI